MVQIKEMEISKEILMIMGMKIINQFRMITSMLSIFIMITKKII